MKFSVEEVAGVVGCDRVPADVPVSGWSIDSRTLAPGDLFFALRGPNHDGHAFLGQAAERGAVAAIVDRAVNSAVPKLLVPDTLEALQTLAAWARSRWTGRMVAVTGSAGKTTTKEVIARLLEVEMAVGKTAGNLNNHVGLPLSVLRLPGDARAAVLEIGMNHAGELRHLAGIARPDVAVVTNVGYAHAEFFGSVEEVAKAKRELVESLPAGGVAVLNADDPLVARFREIHPGPVLTFGLSPAADVRPDDVEYRPDGTRFRYSGTDFETSLAGRHGLLNVLAGLAVARLFGLRPARLRDALRALVPGKMRGERLVHAGITVLNDCYNSNPEAVRSMLEVLRATPARRRFAVLGEMLELGRWSEPLHREVGRYVVECGIDVLVGIRGAARQMVEEAVRSGLPAGAAFFFDEPVGAGASLRGMLQNGDAVLFKGSRGTRVEMALERFLE
jgi:UDP-N-acetylmuramoyl-tripeptide--D-alanyl-D-alanine ligase